MIAQQEALNTLRDRMSAMLAGTSGPALVVDDAGWVAYQQGVRSRDRIEAPAADRSILIPGAGLCLPEKVTGGWLLRPTGDRRASVTLRMRQDPPVLDIHSGTDPLVVPLTPRRAQILAAVTSAGLRGSVPPTSASASTGTATTWSPSAQRSRVCADRSEPCSPPAPIGGPKASTRGWSEGQSNCVAGSWKPHPVAQVLPISPAVAPRPTTARPRGLGWRSRVTRSPVPSVP